MIDLHAKSFFISVLEKDISSHTDYFEERKNGFVDALTDILNRTKKGIYNRNFDYEFDQDELGPNENADIEYDIKRWDAMQKEYEADFNEKKKRMTEEEYALSLDNYMSSMFYIVGRLNGYKYSRVIMKMSCSEGKRACAVALISLRKERQIKVQPPG